MNWLALIAGVFTLLAFLAHAFVGSAELRYVVAADPSPKAAEVRLQIINGWQWVSLDLLLAGIVFVVVAVTDLLGDHERFVLGALSIYFAGAGAVLLVTTAITGKLRPMIMLRLGQWIFCFVVAGLAWFAR